jgi:hypothetical protein
LLMAGADRNVMVRAATPAVVQTPLRRRQQRQRGLQPQ